MRAWTFTPPCEPSALRLRELDLPQPGPGEVRVAVRAVGLNPADWKLLGRPAPGEPLRIAGLDAAGTIDAVGEGVTAWAPGARVQLHTGLARMGAFAESVCVPEWAVAAIPDGLPFEVAAGLPTAGWTAVQVVEHRLRPVSGERLLVVGGASAVGAYCIQLGKAAGAHVTASSSAASFAYLREFGADEVVDVREPGGWSRAHAVAPRGFDAAVDVYGPQSAAEILQHLRFGGRLACCVGAPVFGPDRPFPRGLSLHDILFSGAPLVGDDGPQDDWRPIGESLAGRIAAGELRAAASEVIAFDAIPAALEAMRDGRSRVRYVARLT